MSFWPLTNSDFQTSWPWYRAWPSLNYDWFPWSICNGCGMPVGNGYLPDTLFRPFWGLAYAPIDETSFHRFAQNFMSLIQNLSIELREVSMGAFATSVACQQGELTLPGTCFLPLFWDLLLLKLLRPDFSNLPCRFFTLNTPWYFLDFAWIAGQKLRSR